MNRPNFAKTPEEFDDHRYVSTAQVARAIGVSVTTIKRWVDDGILPGQRTAGGHRKLLTEDVLRLIREGNLPQADLNGLLTGSADPNPALKEFPSRFAEAIRRADYDALPTILHSAYRSGMSIAEIADRILAPGLAEVGHLWATGRIDVMREHRILQSCISALYDMRRLLRRYGDEDRPVAVGGAPERDHYLVPSLLAKLTLLDCGWNAIDLGPNTPLEAYLAAVRELEPKLIWVSVSHIDDPDRFLQDYRRLYDVCFEQRIPLSLGGRGLHDAIRGRMAYTTFGDGMMQLAAFAQSIHRKPQRPKRGRPLGSKGPSTDEV